MADNKQNTNPTQQTGPTPEQIAQQQEKQNIIQLLQSGTTLPEQEINNIKNSGLFNKQEFEEISKINNNNLNETILDFEDKINNGEPLNRKEQNKLIEQYHGTENNELKNKLVDIINQSEQNKNQLPMNDESIASKKRFDRTFNNHQKSGGGSVIHLTDTHGKPKELEYMLTEALSSHGFLKTDERGQPLKGAKHELGKKDMIALTGDLITDFFDQQHEGVQTYLEDAILNKAKNLTKTEQKRFKELYGDLLKRAGLTQEMLELDDPSLGAEQNNPLMMLRALMAGSHKPQGLTIDESIAFRENLSELQGLLKKGMEYHAGEQYKQIKEIFQKYGLKGEHLALISGNHDMYDVMEKHLGEYLVKPGDAKKVGGKNVGTLVKSANGNFMGGPDFDSLFGYAGLKEQAENAMFEHKDFIDLHNEVKEYGITKRDLKSYMHQSVQRMSMGLGEGALGKMLKNKFEKIIANKISKETKRLEKTDMSKYDLMLHHDEIDNPQRSGIEGQIAHEIMRKYADENDKYIASLHGHEHAETSHRKDKIIYLNPGSAAAGNSGIHLFDKNNNYMSSLFSGEDQNRVKTYKHATAGELPGRSAGKYRGQ